MPSLSPSHWGCKKMVWLGIFADLLALHFVFSGLKACYCIIDLSVFFFSMLLVIFACLKSSSAHTPIVWGVHGYCCYWFHISCFSSLWDDIHWMSLRVGYLRMFCDCIYLYCSFTTKACFLTIWRRKCFKVNCFSLWISGPSLSAAPLPFPWSCAAEKCWNCFAEEEA